MAVHGQIWSFTFLKSSAGGIGKACALLLAKEGASNVLVADLAIDAARDTVAECLAVTTNQNFEGQSIHVDITSEESVRGLFREAVSMFGHIDYVINCAGVSSTPVLKFCLLIISWKEA